MVQFRAMADDAMAVEDVLAVVIPWLRACPDLVISDTRQLQHRGGGGRVVFEVLLTHSPSAPIQATAERVSDQPARRPRTSRRRELS